MQFYDRVSAANVRRTEDGYLVADAKVARTGIQEYLASELELTDRDPGEVIRVYRPEEEVFSAGAMRTYAYRPMTNNHPDEQVTADNWKSLSIGQTGGEVARDGEFVRVPLVLMDSQAIADYEGGKRELSMGYRADIVMQDGKTPDGEQYDAVQKTLRMNHLALVDKARGGDQLRIGDQRNSDDLDQPRNQPKGGQLMADNLRKVVLDGLTIETTEQGEQAINKLQQQVADAGQKLVDAEESHRQALADKDKEIAKKDGEIDELKKQVMSDEDLDKAVTERADLISRAKVVADEDYSGKSPADIRKTSVVAVLGDAAVKDKSDDYIEARFDILVDKASEDPVRAALVNQGRNPRQPQDNGQSAYEKRLTDAWKGDQKEVA